MALYTRRDRRDGRYDRTVVTDAEVTRPLDDDEVIVRRTVAYAPPKTRWVSVAAALFVGAAVAAIAVSNFYDPRTAGEKIDAATSAAQTAVKGKVDDLRNASAQAADGGAGVADRAANALGDAGITAAVKTALAADPSLSALKIEVKTSDGVVSLDGPAPDAKSRDRAQVIAAAPEGVQRVDNRLVVVNQ